MVSIERRLIMYLLDTHVACWAVLDANKIQSSTRNTIEEALAVEKLAIADISLWEIAMLIQRRRLIVTLPLQQWIQQLVDSLQLQIIPMTSQIVGDSVQLPEDFHADPADQLIVATARCMNATLVTRDEKILSWAKSGFVKTLAA